MRLELGGCMVVLVVLASTLAYAVEPLVLYDDFNAGQLAQDKWVSEEEGAGTEPTVQVQDNRLRLFNRIYGKTDSDHGKDAGSLFLAFSNAAAVTAIKATVQVNDVRVYGCPSNPCGARPSPSSAALSSIPPPRHPAATCMTCGRPLVWCGILTCAS